MYDNKILKERKIVLKIRDQSYKVKSIILGDKHEEPRYCCGWDSKRHTCFLGIGDFLNGVCGRFVEITTYILEEEPSHLIKLLGVKAQK